MLFTENQIIQHQGQEERTERIIWMERDYSYCFVIDIYSEKAFPVRREVSELEKQLEAGSIKIIMDEPFLIYYLDEELSEKYIQIRDRRMDIIKDLVSAEPDIYAKRGRGKLIRKALKKKKTTEKTIYQYLRLYWQRGKLANSLLPDYKKSGAPNKSRNLTGSKVGRPRKYKEAGIGSNVTEDVLKIINISIKRYYFGGKKPGRNQRTLQLAYEMMIKEFFSTPYYKNGEKKYKVEDIGSIPTYKQFLYWFHKKYSEEEHKEKKRGERRFQLEDRPKLSRSDIDRLGPGSKYQIDATVADVYLVSEKDPNEIIGRPILYIVMDVFSRMVTGMYIGLEGPSWIGGMMALSNTASDKVEYCKQYGIEITEEEWPTKYLPNTLLADRGEIMSKKMEPFIQMFNVRVENTPPYRADFKGIVEQNFRVMNDRVKPLLPGSIDKDFLVRGGEDYRLHAKLDLRDFTEIMIRTVLYHNNHHYLKNYNPEEMMLQDIVPLKPINLWNWGIKNRAGQLREHMKEKVAVYLLPRKRVRVTDKGIKFNNRLYYSCIKAEREKWFSTASIKGTWTVEAAYDPRSLREIYLFNKEGGYEPCSLTPPYEQYAAYSLNEFKFAHRKQKQLEVKHTQKSLSEKVSLDSSIEDVEKRAEKRMEKVMDKNASKASRLADIRKNRGEEKDRNREREKFKRRKVEEEVVTLNESEETEEEVLEWEIELLMKEQEKRKGQTN